MAKDPLSEQPVRIVEDAETGDRFLIYSTDAGLRVELRYEGDALWMTQAQMAALFGVDRTVITKHLANVFEDGELDPGPTSAKIAQVRNEGGRAVTRQIEHYNLDAVISVGYRVSSTQATLFRRWATTVLVRFATKGFVVDVERLRDSGNADRVAELRDIVRDIRSSEANVYAELRRICSLCQDYDPASETAREFYRRTQAKLFYAVVNHTPSELLIDRTNADAPNMGLQSWPKDEIRQQDAVIAKNYLAPAELNELNRLTTILLDIFDDQLQVGRLVIMEDAARLLDRQLQSLGRVVLNHGGVVAHDAAEARAKSEYRRFDTQRKARRIEEANRELLALKAEAKALPKTRATRTASSPTAPPPRIEPPWETRLARALGITPAELDQLEWSIDNNESDDGILYGHVVSFLEGSNEAVLAKLGVKIGGFVQIGPVV